MDHVWIAERRLLPRNHEEHRLRERGRHPGVSDGGQVTAPIPEVAEPEFVEELTLERPGKLDGLWIEVIRTRPVVPEGVYPIGERVVVDGDEQVRVRLGGDAGAGV